MIKNLYKWSLMFFLLVISINSFAQNSPIESYQITNEFKLNFEKNKFEIILNDFSKLKSENRLKTFSDEEKVIIYYIKFCSEVYLGISKDFDYSSFNELIKIINSLNSADEQRNYIVCINNLIDKKAVFFPEWSIILSESIFKNLNFEKIPKWDDLEYILLNTQMISYNRLKKFKEANQIRSKLTTLKNEEQYLFKSILESANYDITISQFELAHKKLMKAESLLTHSNKGVSSQDSISFYIVWARFFKSENNLEKAKQYFKNAYEIARNNNLDGNICLLDFELVLIESDLNLKIHKLENQLNIDKCKSLSLKLSIINSLGVSYGKLKLFEKSLEYYLQVYDFENKYLEKVNEATILNLADGYFKINKYVDAKKYYTKALLNANKKISTNFLFLSNIEKFSYWNKENWLYDKINDFSYHSFEACKSSAEIAFNANLISKSLLLETSIELDHIISQSSDIEMKTQYNKLKQHRKLYSKMQSEGSDKKEIMDQYKFQADSLDKILVNKLGEYAASKRKFEIKWNDVQANLTPSEAAIEFARYYDYADSIYKYMALVVRPEYEYPKLVKLGSESNIKNSCSQKEFSDLYNYVWRGIDSLLSGVKTIYYSPVGELNNVSFSALISKKKTNNQLDSAKSNWSYLMDHYELHQLTTTRYLADGTLKKNKEMPHSIKLIGGVNYTDLPILKDTINKEESNEDFALQLNLQKELNENQSKRGGKINYLKGSEIEVKDISKVLNTSNWSISSSTGKNAGEYQFKEELNKKSPGVLHIATHGFAFPEKEIKRDKEFSTPENTSYKISEDPMVRCGLLLSGANISWSGDSKKMIETTGDDGILTASEVANLDLSNTKLVVLSACETGLGKIESSEGTFGLKRGFKLAGVEQIIVSLWTVPDKETMELMTLFYSDFSKTKDPVVSFNKAQKEMRNRYPYEPEKWAGFVLVR